MDCIFDFTQTIVLNRERCGPPAQCRAQDQGGLPAMCVHIPLINHIVLNDQKLFEYMLFCPQITTIYHWTPAQPTHI